MVNHTAFGASIQWMETPCCSCKYFLEHFLCLFIIIGATLKAEFGITFPRKIHNFMRSTLKKTYFLFAVVFHIQRTETCDRLGPRVSGILHGVGR